MANRARSMQQDATYWPPLVSDKFGNKGFAEPVPIKCRWQNDSIMFRDAAGREVLSQAVVYSDSALEIGGYLYLGLVEYDMPNETPFAYEIRQTNRTENLKATEFLNKVWL